MDATTLLLAFIIGFFILKFIIFQKKNSFAKSGILYKTPIPIIGNAKKALFKRIPFAEIFDEVYYEYHEAKYVGYFDFTMPKIVIRSPELIKDITIKNFDHFVDRSITFNADQEALFANNLIALRGDSWRDMRHLLSPAFTGSKMKGMFVLMKECGKNFGEYMAAEANKGPYVDDMKSNFTKYTNDVIATCVFGISVDSMKNPNNEFYTKTKQAMNFRNASALKFVIMTKFSTIAKLLGLSLFEKSVEKFFESIVKETIETRDREGITRPDMIQLMMESRGTNAINNRELTALEMTAQAFVFFLGGFESSSNTMAFTAHEIAINPHVQEKLHEEIDAVLEATNGDPTYESINGMKYLDAVISEALRLYPPFPFFDRRCTKAYDLPPAFPGAKMVTVQPGETVVFPTYAIQRDPKYFSDANSFQPERFMSNRKNEVNPHTYFPFGQGPRMCIGNRFALLQTKVVLFYLLANCDLKPSEKTDIPMQLTKRKFAMMPKNGFFLRVEPRSNDKPRVTARSNSTNIDAAGE